MSFLLSSQGGALGCPQPPTALAIRLSLVSVKLEVLGPESCEMHRLSMCGTSHGRHSTVQASRISPWASLGFCPLLDVPRMDPHVNCSIYPSSIPLEQPTCHYIWRHTSFEGTCNIKLLQSVLAGPTIGRAFSWMDFPSTVLPLRVASCLI